MNSKLEILVSELRVITQLRRVAALLSWDQETYMPSKGAQARADQTALVLTLSHARFTGPDFRRSLAALVELDSGEVSSDGLLPNEIRLVEMAWRDWHRATVLPLDFVGALAQLTSEAQQVWEEARQKNDFARLAPYLEKIFDMKRHEADYLGFEDHPYDALLDGYEPGMTSAQLAGLIDTLRPTLVDLSARIGDASQPGRADALYLDYNESTQWEFGMSILRDMGFDFTRGRQDLSAHPFTTDFHPSDVRITTRLDANHIMVGVFSTIHEGGHALYEQALDEKYFGTPLCEAISLGIHESQSRLWEIYVGLGRPFWEHYYPRLQGLFPDQLGTVSLDEFYAAINSVFPSTIRMDADEVTYNLHIMLRFELEQAIMDDNIAVSDLPSLWNEGMQNYLGITPESDTEGVLQDIHWSVGSVGYFPSYLLGNLYGCQFYNAAKAQIDGLEERIAGGDLLVLREWLRENIHQLGRGKSAAELTQDITGQQLSAEPFVHYLEDKYRQLYGV